MNVAQVKQHHRMIKIMKKEQIIKIEDYRLKIGSSINSKEISDSKIIVRKIEAFIRDHSLEARA